MKIQNLSKRNSADDINNCDTSVKEAEVKKRIDEPLHIKDLYLTLNFEFKNEYAWQII